MRRLIIGAVLAAAVGTSLAGCGGDETEKAPPQVAWADKVCTGVGMQGKQLSLPQADKDPKAYKANIVTFLGALDKRFADMETGLKGAGAPPVDGADGAVTKALANLTKTRADLAKVKARLEKAKINNKADLDKELKKSGQLMAKSATYAGPRADLRSDPKLTEAFDKAAKCKAKVS